MSAPLRPIGLHPHREVVRPEWVDYNNHLNDAFYLVIFSHATDAMMDQIGLDAAGRERGKHSLFTAELHLNYLKEVKVDTEVRVETMFLGFDAKRLHIFHTMYRGDETEPVATNEQMQLSMDMTGPRVAPFQSDVLAAIEKIAAEHAKLPRPIQSGRAIALPPRKG
ncbi:thioesterase family protein [Dongia sp.]|uniref:thioesterase family protein n=1 Tax=Dongia sp. TaxID=1977262 RepID=UPI0035B3B95E